MTKLDAPKAGSHLRIALAEDDAATREYLATLLRKMGHDVIAAADGRGLVELCRASPPDLVVTGIRMPGPDGVEAVGEVNRQYPVPAILVSAYCDPVLFARSSSPHVMAYLVKPIKEEDLKAAVTLAVPQFRHVRSLAREAAEARQALEDRKFIERAKGAISRRLHVSEEDAFRRQRKRAGNPNRKLIEVAREALAAEEVFRAFE
jgi:AmiR/NasT family two-component response regulator